jgi:hypothetical protein
VATAGNVIAGGLVGLGVDAVTGAGYEHTPNPVSVVLVPNGGAPSAQHRPAKTPTTAQPETLPSKS